MQTLWWRAPEVAFGDAGFGSAALAQQFGTLAATSLAGLPLYQSGLPASTRKPWPADVFAVVGSPGIELLDGLLAWEPSHRVSASAALDRPFFGNGHFSLVGSAGNTGKRHDWNLLAADMPHDGCSHVATGRPVSYRRGARSTEAEFRHVRQANEERGREEDNLTGLFERGAGDEANV